MADQDQTIEKKVQGKEKGRLEGVSDEDLNKSKSELEGSEKEMENTSFSEKEQEKQKETIELIQQGKSFRNSNDKDNSKSDSEDNEKKNIDSHARNIFEIKDTDQQIEKLVQLAMQKDPYTAIKVAKHLDENYVLDQVHDKLREDEVRKILIEKGLLKEV